MTTSKIWRLSWVVILVVSAFFLGRHLRPDTRQARLPPPLTNFGAPPPAAPPVRGAPQRMPPPPGWSPGNPTNQGGRR